MPAELNVEPISGIMRRCRVECSCCRWFGYRPRWFEHGKPGFDNMAAGTISILGEESKPDCPKCGSFVSFTKVAGKWHR